MIDKCDICGKHTNLLADYYAKICMDCKKKHTDMKLLRLLGKALNQLEGRRK